MRKDVGELRVQFALCNSETPVELTFEPLLENYLRASKLRIEVRGFFPDTTNNLGEWKPTFKIQLAGIIDTDA